MNLVIHLTGITTWATSLQYRDFRILWSSTFLYSLGSGMEQVAVGWLVFDLTGSAFMVGVASAARMAPFFFLGALSGVVADWVDRRTLLQFITLGGSLVAGLMALLLLTGSTLVWYVIALVTAGGCFMAFALTTRQAITYDIVGPEHALNGLSLTTFSMLAGGIAGAVVSGALIQALGPGWQYVAVSASYLASVAVLLAIRVTKQGAQPRPESLLPMVTGYLRLIQQNRVLLVLMFLASATEIFGFAHMTLLPVFAKDVLDVGPMGLGVLTAVRQGGGLLGLSLLAGLGNYRRKGVLVFVVAGGFGLGLMAFSLSSNLFFFIVVLAVVNACAMAVDTLYRTLMQENVSNEQRGRAMGSWVLSIGMGPIGHLEVGGLASILGAPGALLVNGAILTTISLATALCLPRIRRLQ